MVHPMIEGFENRTERVGDIDLHYWVGGNPGGQPVLLWHGFLIAVGGALSRGDQVREMVETVAETVTGVVIPGCGHFVPEERPDRIVDLVLGLTGPSA